MLRFHRLAGATALASLAVFSSASAPSAGFAGPNLIEGELCLARSPRLSHPYARLAASQIAATDPAAISNEDHADFLVKLGLLEGHLVIGKALLEADQPRAALPHFGHPVRELYDDLHESFGARSIKEFAAELIALEAMVTAKPKDPAIAPKFAAVMDIVAAARATVPATLRQSEPFMLGVLGEVMEMASEDYSEAIEGGRIEKPVEYHDSRGYLIYAAGEMARLEAQSGRNGDARLKAFRGELVKAQAIVAPLLPPQKPVKTVAAFKGIVKSAKSIAAQS
jgi:hypothetical protein